MAANDYYTAYRPGGGQQDTAYHSDGERTNAPLPPVPASPLHRPYRPAVETSNISPVQSPFDDNQYPTYPRPSQYDNPPYYGQPGQNGSKYSYNDPFEDSNAIPLQNQGTNSGKLGGVGVMASPTSAMGAAEHGNKSHRRKRKDKQGWFTGKITWACYILFLGQVSVFIAEIARNAILTSSPIEIHPNFNPMIGPSPYVLINMGARYVPCMRAINVTLNSEIITVASPKVSMQCPNTTTNDANCHLADLCGNGMNLSPSSDGTQPQPNQWWRFITPIFLHGGIIHIGFNMLLQLTLGRDIELQIGTLRFLLVYFSAGIFGFVLGGNFAPNNIPSTGCSGSLFGIIALILLDLLYTWKSRVSPVRDLLFILLDIVISFVLGLLPALDNFSHIGGFLIGLCLGICILHSPDSLRERTGMDDAKYDSVPPFDNHATGLGGGDKNGATAAEVRTFAKQPVGFFKGRKPLWWGWWLLRAGALVGVFLAFVLLIRNFYVFEKKCGWCKYLSCLPIKNWCDLGNLEFQNTSNAKRAIDIFMEAVAV